MSLTQGNPILRPGCSTPPPKAREALPAVNSSPLAELNGHETTTPPKRARKPIEPAVVAIKGKHCVAKRKRVILPDNDLPRPPPSPFFTFQMPPPSIAGRQIKRLRSSTSSGCDPFLVTLKQFPVVSGLYAPSRGSKREASEVLPSSDDLGPVVFELEEGSVIDNGMDIDPASSLEHHPEEDDIFSD